MYQLVVGYYVKLLVYFRVFVGCLLVLVFVSCGSGSGGGIGLVFVSCSSGGGIS